jgi:hypothetical protein
MKPENNKNKNSQQLDEVEIKLDGIEINGQVYPSTNAKAMKAILDKKLLEKEKQVADKKIIKK